MPSGITHVSHIIKVTITRLQKLTNLKIYGIKTEPGWLNKNYLNHINLNKTRNFNFHVSHSRHSKLRYGHNMLSKHQYLRVRIYILLPKTTDSILISMSPYIFTHKNAVQNGDKHWTALNNGTKQGKKKHRVEVKPNSHYRSKTTSTRTIHISR